MTHDDLERLASKLTEADILAWMRKDVAPEALRMMLAAGLPGGTRTERTKRAAFAEGCSHAVSMIIAAVERGDIRTHLERR